MYSDTTGVLISRIWRLNSACTTLAMMLQSGNIANELRDDLSQQAQEELQQLRCLLVSNPIRLTIGSDSATWLWEKSCQFTVKSAYYALKNTPRIQSDIHRIWKLMVPPRMQVFSWILSLNRLLTVDNLMKRCWQMTNRCVMCKVNSESAIH